MKQAVKIIFVSGKGGVGKSTVAAALALAKARSGLKTLLVELGTRSFFAKAFGRDFSYTPQTWKEGVDVAVWDGSSCLKEYGLHFIRSEALYHLFFENQVSKALIQVAPGLPELAILGKITSGPPRNVGPKVPYDCIVVDAFASGHFLALLKAPMGFSEAIHFGPMGTQTRAILDVLKNPEICEYHFVCLPEELPVQETLELCSEFKALIPIEPKIHLNRCLPSAEVGSKTGRFAEDIVERINRQKKAEQKLSSGSLQKLPWVFDNSFAEVSTLLAANVGVK